jgi:hypothetical protein
MELKENVEKMAANNEKFACPICDSKCLESYTTDNNIYIGCDKSGHIRSEHNFRGSGINYRSILSILTGMTIFTVVFAFAIKIVSAYMGISM